MKIQKLDQDEQKPVVEADEDGNYDGDDVVAVVVVVEEEAMLAEAAAEAVDDGDVFAEVVQAEIEVAWNCLSDYVFEKHTLADFAMIFGDVLP